MDADLAFVSRLIRDPEPDLSGFRQEWLRGDGQKVFSFIIKHKQEHKIRRMRGIETPSPFSWVNMKLTTPEQGEGR